MAVYKKNSYYYIEYSYGGKRFREKIGKNKRIARVVLAKVRAEIAECRRNKNGSL